MPDLDVAEHRTTDADLAALLDAIPDATAVLDTEGTIVAVNHAWRMFSVDNGGDPEKTGVGVSYVDVCVRAAAAGCPDAIAVHACLEAVLAVAPSTRSSTTPARRRRWVAGSTCGSRRSPVGATACSSAT
jgi:hypothetical protein